MILGSFPGIYSFINLANYFRPSKQWSWTGHWAGYWNPNVKGVLRRWRWVYEGGGGVLIFKMRGEGKSSVFYVCQVPPSVKMYFKLISWFLNSQKDKMGDFKDFVSFCFVHWPSLIAIDHSLHYIDHFCIVSIRPGWAHSQRRVGVNITIPLHWPSCEWTLTLPIFLVFVRYQQ